MGLEIACRNSRKLTVPIFAPSFRRFSTERDSGSRRKMSSKATSVSEKSDSPNKDNFDVNCGHDQKIQNR